MFLVWIYVLSLAFVLLVWFCLPDRDLDLTKKYFVVMRRYMGVRRQLVEAGAFDEFRSMPYHLPYYEGMSKNCQHLTPEFFCWLIEYQASVAKITDNPAISDEVKKIVAQDIRVNDLIVFKCTGIDV